MTALFSRFFKKNRPSKPALKKTPAVDQAPLAQGASEHDHIPLGQIQEVERLDALEPFLSAKPQPIKTAAIDRLESLLFEGATSLDEKTQRLNAHADEGIALKLVALWHPDETLQHQAIALQLEQGTTTQEQICAWIEQCPISRTRQTLAEHLTQEPLLEQLYQHFRSKDKRLSRQLKDKLLEYQETKRAQMQALNAQLKIVGQLEQLALSAYSPNYSAQVLHAQQQWRQQLPTIEPELQTRFATALKQAQAQIDLHQAEERAQEALNQAIAIAHKQQQGLVTEAQALLEQLKASDPDTETCQSMALSQLQQRWSEAAVAAKPDASTKAAFQAALKPLIQFQESGARLSELSDTLTSLIEDTSAPVHARYQRLSKQLKSIHWPKEFERPQQLNSALEVQQQLERQLETTKAQEKQSLNAYKNVLKSLKEHLNKQWLKESQKYHQKASHLLKHLSPKAAEPLQAEFKLLSAQLQELKDWQGFATLPKREALCESMEALLTSDMHPETLATAIQALQDEWKALGGGDPKISQPLWERFKAASDQAYASCKAFYTAQAEIRQQNFESRTRICEELEQLLSDENWDRSHWKAVQTIIEGARTQWRQYTPVDRIKNKPLQSRFQKNILALRAIVQAVFDQHAAAKSGLVDQAQALLSLSDLKQATEQAKQLQQEWKSLGNAGNQDQALWKAFREHCDALFDKRQNEYLAKKETVQSNIKQAEALVEQGQALLDQPALSAAERLKQQQALSAQLKDIALPASVQQALQQKLERVEHELTQAGHQQQKNRKVSQWQNLRAKAQIITDLETHLIASTEADLEALNAAFLTPTELPKDAQALLQTRWQSVTDAFENPSPLSLQDQLPHNEEHLRLLCIRLEILADAETPKEDRELRMNYQVQKLTKGLGQSTKVPLLMAAQSLELEWHQTGPVTFNAREHLSRRFFNLMDQLIEKLQKN